MVLEGFVLGRKRLDALGDLVELPLVLQLDLTRFKLLVIVQQLQFNIVNSLYYKIRLGAMFEFGMYKCARARPGISGILRRSRGTAALAA